MTTHSWPKNDMAYGPEVPKWVFAKFYVKCTQPDSR